MRWLYIVFFGLVIGCNPQDKTDGKTRIVCTTGMIGDAVKNMVDSTCVVNVLMGPGTDPHLFKPTKESLDLLSGADIIVANGLHLEGKMQGILQKLGTTKSIYFLAEGISGDELILSDSTSGIYDPHIWFDVALWRESLSIFQKEYTPAGIIDGPAAETYLKALSDLDNWVKSQIETIPERKRVLITAHDAFSYFGRAYDVEVIGLQGISTVSEYGLRDISNLVNTIVEREIPAVFIESSVSPRAIQAVIEGCQKKGFQTTLGGTLYSDALGPAGSEAETYRDMVKMNVSTLKSALQ